MISRLENHREESVIILSPPGQDQAAPRVLSQLFGVSIHILQSSMANAVVQACSRWVVVGIKVVWLHVPYIAHWIDEAVQQICGNGHGAPYLLTKRQKVCLLLGSPLALRASHAIWRLTSMPLTKSRIWSRVCRQDSILWTMSPT